MVMSTYVGPLWSHSKHFLFSGMAVWNSRIETVCFSLSFWLWVLLLLLDFRLISEHTTYKISLGKKNLAEQKIICFLTKSTGTFFKPPWLTDWFLVSAKRLSTVQWRVYVLLTAQLRSKKQNLAVTLWVFLFFAKCFFKKVIWNAIYLTTIRF